MIKSGKAHFRRLRTVSPNLRSGVIFFLFLVFASLLLWLEKEKNDALLPKTDYRRKGRGHDRRLSVPWYWIRFGLEKFD